MWEDDEIRHEADQGHAEIIVGTFGLNKAKSCVRLAVNQEERDIGYVKYERCESVQGVGGEDSR